MFKIRNDKPKTQRVAIIGAGLGGIAALVKLKGAGFEDVTIFERADGPGGTWHDNHYPGAACDIASHLYSYSFRLNNWRGTHANQAEIIGYVEAVIREFDLAPHFRFGTPVAAVEWDDAAEEYELTTEAGATERFDFVIAALGQLNHPRYPDWPGLDEFERPRFHTARWEHEHDLEGLRVAVVGTGSTAAQVVPALAPIVGELYLYQREPGWVTPKDSYTYSGRARRLFRHDLAKWYERSKVYMRNELRIKALDPESKAQVEGREGCLEYLASVVEDPELRDALTPQYEFRCKRPVRSSEFYPALTRDNVNLVSHAVVRLTPTGVVDASGTEREVDVLVMATGFQPTKFLATLEVRGRGGVSIHDAWGDEPEAFLGITYPGFPNFFMLYGPNTNSSTTSLIFVLERQAEYIVQTLRRVAARGARTVEPSERATASYNEWIQKGLRGSAYEGACNNYYRSPSGKVVTNWPYTSVLYWASTKLLGRSSVGLRLGRSRSLP